MIMKKSIIWIAVSLTLAICFLVFFFFPFVTRSVKEPSFIVRVRIMNNAGEVKVASDKKCEILDARTGYVLENGVLFPGSVKILSAPDGIRAGGKIFKFDRLRISPGGKGDLVLNGTAYRGDIDIIRKEGGLDIINRAELEDYLKGVIPREVHPLWPYSALKAQAIASRSFAVYQALIRKNKDYDLTGDASSQVYGGKAGERWRTTRAVEATRGKILEYRGKAFPAYFHSCCGGHTENVSRLWDQKIKPLKGVKCQWCRWSPRFRWTIRVPTRTILEKLREKGYDIKRVDNIKEGKRDPSGRLEYVDVKSGNKWLNIKTEHFRSALGKKNLMSANFSIKKYPFFYLFGGHGWGHGVGMCQWGAFGMSLRRWSAERILNYYYPGTRIVSLSEVLR
ncbi:MAG: SpoIID/LytB domain-containing protein [Candidatus Omnitrophota bacterium]